MPDSRHESGHVARRWLSALKCRSIRLHEPERTVVERLDLNAAFVHETVVEPAERDEVR
jgi:hypothetical protein